MPESGSRSCSQCGNVQSEGDFCEKCGAQLPPTVGDVGFPPATVVEPAPPLPSSPPSAPPWSAPPSSVPPAAAAVGAAASDGPASQPPQAAQAGGAYSSPPSTQPQYAQQPPAQQPPYPQQSHSAQQAPGQAPPYTPSYGQPSYGGAGYGGTPPPARGGTGFFGSLFDLSFTHFVTPKIIKFLFILVLVGIGLMVLGMIIAGFSNGFGTGLFVLIIGGPLVALLAVLYARALLEIIIVLFRMEEHLAELAKKR